ncbi:MAG: hypothetical protein LBU90_06875 [Bacteroidales bacterium]|jgi:tRNA G18 (ribose-2'-O)-methylase SpoU|nr:hypothetical protein [Bacteroidales bacterium]
MSTDTNIQLDYSSHRRNTLKHHVSVVLDGVSQSANVGGIIRTADALGVEKIYVSTQHNQLSATILKKTSRGLIGKIPSEFGCDTLAVVKHLKAEAYTIVAVEITNKSKEVSLIDFSPYHRIALIVGAEDGGISPEILQEVDITAHINMLGYGSSMNVGVALGIALYHITQDLQS